MYLINNNNNNNNNVWANDSKIFSTEELKTCMW